MNLFERLLFRSAVILAAVLVALRVGSIALMWYWHHGR